MPTLRAALQDASRYRCVVNTRASVLECGSPLPLSMLKEWDARIWIEASCLVSDQ
jgi:hypothetical protein